MARFRRIARRLRYRKNRDMAFSRRNVLRDMESPRQEVHPRRDRGHYSSLAQSERIPTERRDESVYILSQPEALIVAPEQLDYAQLVDCRQLGTLTNLRRNFRFAG
jgi:hypothetical protein